jgi:phosphatidylglycerol:prolipoprotein diacylglycerol transferase
MYPELFTIPEFDLGPLTIGPITIHSFGLMVGIGFLVAAAVLNRELKERRIDQEHTNPIVLLTMVFGIMGSKLLHVLENFDQFLVNPGILWSAGGLTWYGGFFLATFAVWRYAVKKKLKFSRIVDSCAPALMLGYGVARIGCHLAGDGDYGMPTDLPWASVYANGTSPPSQVFADFPEVVAQYGVNGVVPDTIPVHPAPLYELGLGILGYVILRRVRRFGWADGRLFMVYLMLAGFFRLLVETIRLNPRVLLGLTEAQVISVVLIAAGAIGFARLASPAGPSGGGPRAGTPSSSGQRPGS